MTPELFLRTFGSPALLSRIAVAEEQILLGRGKPLLILASLEAHPDGVAREELATLGWGDSPDPAARASLRQALLRLRQVLGEAQIIGDDERVALATPLPSDRAAFLSAITAGDDFAACAAYGGPYLDGVPVSDADDLANWATQERARFAALWRDAAIRLSHGRLDQGDFDAATALATDVLQTFPESVAAWAIRLDALHRAGIAGLHRDAMAQLEVLLSGDTFDQTTRAEAASLHRRHLHTADQAVSPGVLRLPLVGRHALLHRLLSVVTAGAGSDEPRAVVLEGSAGLGKSRVLQELVERVAREHVTTAFVAALPSERRTRWALLNRVVRALGSLAGAAGIDRASADTLVRLDPGLAERFPAARPTPATPPEQAALVAALADLLAAVHSEAPLVLILDDLHLGDAESIAVIAGAVERVAHQGVITIAAARPWHRHVPAAWPRWQMTPLNHDDLVSFVQLVLPRLPAALQAPVAEQLVLITGGIPLYLRLALRLLVDEGVLRPETGAWAADHPDRLVRVVAKLSLQRDPLFPRLPGEQALLGYLEVAEEPVAPEELAEALSGYPALHLPETLERLAQAGWLHLDDAAGGGATLAHAVVADEVRNALAPEMRATLQRRRAEWLQRHGTTLAQLQAAIRLYGATDAIDEAVTAARDWRRRTGTRVSGLGKLIIPEHASRLFRWRLRLAASRWENVALTGIAAVVLAAIAWVYWLGQPGELVLENQPVVESVISISRATSNIEPPRLTVRDHRGRITGALDGQPLSVQVVGGADSIKILGGPVIKDGRVVATAIDLWTPERYDSVLLRFSVGALSSKPVVVNYGWSHFWLQLANGMVAGQSVDGPRPTIHVAPGAPLDGLVVLRYATPSRAAAYMLAESSTLLDYRSDTTSLMTLTPGALNGAVKVRFNRTAPTLPGTYWLVWGLAAESSAGGIWSSTNWECRDPVWGDGNDVLAATDSIERLPDWGRGTVNVTKLYCHAGKEKAYSWDDLRVAAVRVIVDRK